MAWAPLTTIRPSTRETSPASASSARAKPRRGINVERARQGFLECLSGGDASALATTRSAYVPLDMIAAVGDGVPIVVAFGIPGDGKHLPEAANLDAFDDVDSRHNISPASRILADSKGDNTRSK
jgi:hypothetical protein